VSSLTRRRQVVIVGGGIGGLCAAIAMRQVGLRVVVLERAAALREVGAGILLWPNAVRVLRRLEVGAAVEKAGAVATQGGLRSSRGNPLGSGLAEEVAARFGAPLVVVHRGLLQAILLGALDQGVLRLGAECVGVAQDAAGVTVRLADGSTEQGDLVVGADGLHSRVRAVLVGDGPPRYSGYTAWRAIVPLDLSLADRLRPGESWGRGCLFGVARLGGNQAYWWASARTDEGSGGSRAEEKAVVARRFSVWHEPIPELIDATLDQAIVRGGLYDRPALASWSAGRIGLLGDAAHPMLANLGQGACQAIEDAAVLGDAVGAGSDVTAALEAYGARRVPPAAAAVRRSRQVAHLAHLRDPVAVALRDALLRATPSAVVWRRLGPILDHEGEAGGLAPSGVSGLGL
jgi:2-polyprenyl-6-methoxyphenol hydroxylase-like FAD-dependent oxidoreductase